MIKHAFLSNIHHLISNSSAMTCGIIRIGLDGNLGNTKDITCELRQYFNKTKPN